MLYLSNKLYFVTMHLGTAPNLIALKSRNEKKKKLKARISSQNFKVHHSVFMTDILSNNVNASASPAVKCHQ